MKTKTLIYRDKFKMLKSIAYGIGHSRYKEELDEIANIMDKEMK